MKLKLLSIMFFLFSFLSFSNEAKKKSSPNFIIILVDDQGWNGTSVQMMDKEINSKSDFYQTPNIEKLAKKGIRFSSAYSGAPVCAPSRYSIQFGQTPARLKMIRVGMNTSHINHSTDLTIPKQLKSVNLIILRLILVNGELMLSLQFLVMTTVMGLQVIKMVDLIINHQERYNGVIPLQRILRKSLVTTQSAIDFIESQAKSETPFFLQVSHYAVHSDIMAREETLEKYKNKEIRRLRSDWRNRIDRGFG